jgi:hypothetical protein
MSTLEQLIEEMRGKGVVEGGAGYDPIRALRTNIRIIEGTLKKLKDAASEIDSGDPKDMDFLIKSVLIGESFLARALNVLKHYKHPRKRELLMKPLSQAIKKYR